MDGFRMMTFINKRNGKRCGILIQHLKHFCATNEDFLNAITNRTMFFAAKKCGLNDDFIPEDIVTLEEIRDSSDDCWIHARDEHGNE